MKRCILYSAYGSWYIQEAVKSATKTRLHLPDDVDLVLHTPNTKFKNPIFDKIIVQPFAAGVDRRKKEFHYRQRGFLHLEHSDYDRILFLDTDAFLSRADALCVFDVLDQFDIAATYAPIRYPGGFKSTAVPDCFPEFNCGVLGFNNTELVRSFIRDWEHCYLTNTPPHPHDQGAFRHALYHSKLRVATLPREYNYRPGIKHRSDYKKFFTEDESWVRIYHPDRANVHKCK